MSLCLKKTENMAAILMLVTIETLTRNLKTFRNNWFPCFSRCGGKTSCFSCNSCGYGKLTTASKMCDLSVNRSLIDFMMAIS